MSARRQFLFVVFALSLLFGGLFVTSVWKQYQDFLISEIPVDQVPITLTIEKGMTFGTFLDSMPLQGFHASPEYMEWYARSSGVAGKIRAGKYTFYTAPTPVELVDRIVSGQEDYFRFTLVEGRTFRQLLDELKRARGLVNDIEGLDQDAIMLKVAGPDLHPEGMFMPDTYHYPQATTISQFLRRAYKAMQSFLDMSWKDRDEGLPLKTPYEALILASIIEKETGVEEERSEIAGVFVRRLKMGMKLQTDPTVIYGMGEMYDGNIRRKDLRHDTPYNTYTRHGLPPTPIAMPGRAAILAALHPAPGNTLYFVARGDGTHHFSATLEEHNRAVARYQLKKKTSQ